MSLFITSLNSGSNGNCYYIGNGEEAVLIDGGISCRETEKRMKRLGLSIKKVKAIFITHEHGDHIHGVPALSRRHNLPVYITSKTQQHIQLDLKQELTFHFNAYEPVRIGKLEITGFPKFHDALDPHSFIVASDNVKVGVFTDIGRACNHVINHFKQCHAAFLESNYDEQMLENGRYPYPLKNRIRGGHGHLSNTQAIDLVKRHKPAFMTHLFLSHLSRDNNRPELVEELFTQIAGKTKIIVASRSKETPIYPIRNGFGSSQRSFRANPFSSHAQLSLFQ